jgi:hypothetical protein
VSKHARGKEKDSMIHEREEKRKKKREDKKRRKRKRKGKGRRKIEKLRKKESGAKNLFWP